MGLLVGCISAVSCTVLFFYPPFLNILACFNSYLHVFHKYKQAQLLAQDVENSVAILDETCDANASDRVEDELRKLLTEVFVDNARLRMQVNSVIRCALNAHLKSDKDDDVEEENPLRKTVLSKFLER